MGGHNTFTLEKDMSKKKEELIKFASNKWQEHFLSLLEEGESFQRDGKTVPKAMGLLCAAQRAVGDVSYKTHCVKAATESDISATMLVDVEIVVRSETLEGLENAPSVMRGQGVADAGRVNTEMPYGAHAAATAHTRALGRAIKQALFLKVHCAEELGVASPEEYGHLISENPNAISETKIRSILNLIERLNVNQDFSIDHLGGPAETALRDGSVSKEIADAFLSMLNEYQNGEVPEKYKVKA